MEKIRIILLLWFGFSFSAFAQTDDASPLLSLDFQNQPLKEILSKITNQSKLEFSFNAQRIDVDQLVSIKVENEKLESVLKILCDKLNTKYQFIEGIIVLQMKEEEEAPFYTLSGFIGDEETGESLIGVAVAVAGTSRGVTSNEFGYYSLQLRPGIHDIVYSYIGYDRRSVRLEINKNLRENSKLKLASYELPDIIVETPDNIKMEKKHLDGMSMSPDVLLNMPEFGGESGLIKGLQSLPGIQMHGDASIFFYVRGGERDQNLVIIDDAPIYNPSHLLGLYSTIVPDFLKTVNVYKSDIPSNLGDRLSSIIDIRTKDGNLNKLTFSGAFNPLIYRLSLETPIVKKKGALLLSFRRSNFEWLYKRRTPNANLGFIDFNLKLNYKLNEKNRLFFTTILSADDFTNGRLKAGLSWANFASTFRWNHIFGPKLFSNTTIYTGSYTYRMNFPPNYWNSGVGTLSFKTDFTHYKSPKFNAKFGLEAQAYFINPGTLSLDTTINFIPEITTNYSRKLALYYQGAYTFSDRLKVKAGVRSVSWSNLGPEKHYAFDSDYQPVDTINSGAGIYNRYRRLDPRLSVQYQLDSTSQIKASAGMYHQYLQLVSNSESPFSSFEVWLPASPNIRPQSAFQASASYLKNWYKPGLEFSAAVFYKKYENQIDYEPHPVTLLNPLIEGELRFGSMKSYGLELMFKKELGRLNGWMAYTYSRAKRITPDVNNGRTYLAFQDRPHDFSLMLNYQLKRRIHCSLYWTAYSGSTFSAPTGFYTYNGRTIPIFDEKNNGRLPTYRRTDIAFKFILNKNEEARYKHSLTFSVYNFFSHKNIVFVKFNKLPVEGERPVVKADLFNQTALSASQIDLIRFFPSLTYKFNL